MSTSFRLLTRTRLLVVTRDPDWMALLQREGYQVVATHPLNRTGWFFFLLQLSFRFRKYHWLIDSPLPAAEESSLKLALRLFPFLIRSWTRAENGFDALLESRLIQLAESDYNQGSTKGHSDVESLEIAPRSPEVPATEFDQILEASRS